MEFVDDNNYDSEHNLNDGINEDSKSEERHLIVNYLPQNFTDKQLYQLFSPFGPVESLKIMRDQRTGYSFGFAFVNFLYENDAKAARHALNRYQIEHKRIKISLARPCSDDIKDTNLFISGLPLTFNDEDLFRMFSAYGEILQCHLLRDKFTKLPRGLAFVRYDKRDEAFAAIRALNQSLPTGETTPIRVRLAQDHGKQKAAYIAGFRAALIQRKTKYGVTTVVERRSNRTLNDYGFGYSQDDEHLVHSTARWNGPRLGTA
ncbi:unnamed protein product [Orchesella dallaii]|uniref:Protein alan shepard n=1 Tax=Orchesella dallaii TaxID=48710 RepID=A0ABP1RCX7_9HEXA